MNLTAFLRYRILPPGFERSCSYPLIAFGRLTQVLFHAKKAPCERPSYYFSISLHHIALALAMLVKGEVL